MCTLVAWIDVFPDAPLAIAANRDERLGRAAEGPARREGARPYVAPVDLVAGGTWWALTESDVFVALTNRAGAMIGAGRRSRGLLVTDLAQLADLAEIEVFLRRIGPGDYNGFHLLATDGRAGVRAIHTGEGLAIERLGRGRHVLTERGFGASATSRDARVEALFAPLERRPFDVEAAQALLGSHFEEPLDALCVHLPDADYGTRSSTVLALGPARRELWFAPGRPCVTPYEELSALLSPAEARDPGR